MVIIHISLEITSNEIEIIIPARKNFQYWREFFYPFPNFIRVDATVKAQLEIRLINRVFQIAMDNLLFKYPKKDTTMRAVKKLPTLLILSMIICLNLTSSTNIRNLQEAAGKVLMKEICVIERSAIYYAYRVYTDSGSIVVNLLDSNVHDYEFTYKTSDPGNNLFFRDAYNKFIIVEEMTQTNNTVTYWLLIITRIVTDNVEVYSLDSFKVNSLVDNEGQQFHNSYLLKNIVEYNEVYNLLYVMMDSTTDSKIYEIDLTNRGNVMQVIGFFYYSTTPREKITGGNSKVLVEGTTDSFWFNAGNFINAYVTSIYNKVSASSLTSYPIYLQSSYTLPFLSSYFQYISLSSDGLNLTTFTFKDYIQTTKIYAEASINSTTQPIKIFSDQQNFFLAIADNDIYISVVKWNPIFRDYSIFWIKLTMFTSDQSLRKKWIEVFNSIIFVILVKGELFMLSQTTFYVYSLTSTYEQQLPTSINSDSNVENILFTYMKKYLSNLKSK